MITIDDIKTANKVRHHHFFDPETIRFFNSRTLPEVYSGPGGVFFVTSEKMSDDSPRLYTVRHFYPDTGSITTALVDGDIVKQMHCGGNSHGVGKSENFSP